MVWFSYLPTFNFAMYGLQIAVGSISIICGIANLLLIYHMKIWNQFILLIVHLAFSQLVFDMTALLYFCDPSTNRVCYPIVYGALAYYMGIVVTLWTNVIVTVLFSSIFYLNPNIAKDNFKVIFTSIHLFGLLIKILNGLLITTMSKLSDIFG